MTNEKTGENTMANLRKRFIAVDDIYCNAHYISAENAMRMSGLVETVQLVRWDEKTNRAIFSVTVKHERTGTVELGKIAQGFWGWSVPKPKDAVVSGLVIWQGVCTHRGQTLAIERLRKVDGIEDATVVQSMPEWNSTVVYVARKARITLDMLEKEMDIILKKIKWDRGEE